MLKDVWPKANWGLKVDKNQWTSARIQQKSTNETDFGKMTHRTHTHNYLTSLVLQSESHMKEFVVICLYSQHPLNQLNLPPLPSISPLLRSLVLMSLSYQSSPVSPFVCTTTTSVWFTNPPVARTSPGSFGGICQPQLGIPVPNCCPLWQPPQILPCVVEPSLCWSWTVMISS